MMHSEGKESISIVIVVFNGAESLEKTLISAISVKDDGDRILVIDGGSVDGTVDIIKKHEEHIFFWSSAPDNGIYDAMNKAWEKVSISSFVLFLGCGDLLLSLPDRHFLEKNKKCVIFGRVKIGEKVFLPSLGWRLRVGNTLHHQALLVPKCLHPAPPFNLSYPVYADYDFNIRLFKEGVRFVYSEELNSFAMPGGVSESADLSGMSCVVSDNFGPLWGGGVKILLRLAKPEETYLRRMNFY